MGIVNDHFVNVRISLLNKAKEIGLANNSTVLGVARELVISQFLEANLPRTAEFLTGEVVDSKQNRSGQVDIVLLPVTAPKIELSPGIALALADAISSAVEVKSNLTTGGWEKDSHLKSALKTSAKIKALKLLCDPWPWQASTQIKGKLTEVKLVSIPVSVVAFQGPTKETLLEKLAEVTSEIGLKYLGYPEGIPVINLLPDTITVLEHDYTIVLNNNWNIVGQNSGKPVYAHMPDESCLYQLFSHLMKCIQAWHYYQPRTPLSNYF